MSLDFHRALQGRSPFQIGLLSLVLVALVGAIDSLTGYEMSFSIFYLIPVSIGAWYCSPRVAIGVCLLAAAVWLAADIEAGHEYSSAWIPFWNAGVRLGFFVIVAYLLIRLRVLLDATETLAQTDLLTGLFNASSVKQRYEQAARLAGRHRHLVALGFIDLDDFKAVNDNHGHQVGDEVLVGVAATLKERMRGSDIAGRIGGDEFIVVLPHTDFDGAEVVFSQLHAALGRLAATHHWPVGFSIGVAVFSPPPPSAEAAFAFADALMYEVKKAGKNAIRLRLVPGADERSGQAPAWVHNGPDGDRNESA